jgi:carbonic anhydrase
VYGINDGKLMDMGIAVSGRDQLAPAVAQRLAKYDAVEG